MQLLQKDPNTRISWEEFFGHPWLGFENVSPLLPSSPLSLSPQPLSLLDMRGRSVSTPILPAGHPLAKQQQPPPAATVAPVQSAAQFITALKETSLTPSTSGHGLAPVSTSPPSPRVPPACAPTPLLFAFFFFTLLYQSTMTEFLLVLVDHRPQAQQHLPLCCRLVLCLLALPPHLSTPLRPFLRRHNRSWHRSSH